MDRAVHLIRIKIPAFPFLLGCPSCARGSTYSALPVILAGVLLTMGTPLRRSFLPSIFGTCAGVDLPLACVFLFVGVGILSTIVYLRDCWRDGAD